ncbi:uncharacterized protein LOC134530450 [Bacillus rossius redtenbacheri]|uniref:uncharacterized protein LOC134530450 n=1 Tax=Bacillus rossius redtenbacheri TaxID=93214 RepID=UPI002FDCFAB1
MEQNSDIEAVLGVVGVICALQIACALKSSRWRRRRWWTRPWIQRRDEGAGCVHRLVNEELKMEDPESYKNYLRMDEQSFQKLKRVVESRIKKKSTNMRQSISVEKRLSVTLRFLATGETYQSLSFAYRITASTLSGIIPSTCRAIYDALKDDYLKVPNTTEEWSKVSRDFYDQWNFPNCLGAMDGKHIQFQVPRCYGSYFYNYKGFNSIVLLAVVDANYRFLFLDVGCNGRVSDGGVYNNSDLSSLVKNNSLNFPPPMNLPNTNIVSPFTLVADDAFPLHPHIMKPYSQRFATKERKVFNYCLSRARRVVKNAFGILANRFRVLLTKINLSVDKVQTITLAACALHNYLIQEHSSSYLSGIETEDTQNSTFKQGYSLKGLRAHIGNRCQNSAIEIRNKLCAYFNSIGAVPWQWECVNKFNF